MYSTSFYPAVADTENSLETDTSREPFCTRSSRHEFGVPTPSTADFMQAMYGRQLSPRAKGFESIDVAQVKHD